ncbi:MAG: glycosyltransferase [Acidobacteria bacterium]|nr:glycosyltransferase [Acidobacteriota bacterium]
MPRISVLMPTHNRADVLGHAIESVLRQTEDDFELLIVGDGCTDTTAEVVADFGDNRIRWYDLPKAPYYGYANRNIALREAKGELIAFAAHDDLFSPDHLELLASAIDETGVDWIYSRPLWVSTDGIIVPFCTNLNNADELDVFLNVGNTIPAPCVMHRSKCFDRSGYWPEDVPSAADWQLWVRIINDGDRANFSYLKTPTTLHFSADWKKSRHSAVNEVKAQLEIADEASWWPASLRHDIPEDRTEQSVVFAAMTNGGNEWCRRVRKDVITVIDRLAWDQVRYTHPLCQDQATQIERLTQLTQSQTAQIEHLNSLRTSEGDQAEEKIAALQSTLDQIFKSRSWRLTAPLRRLAAGRTRRA